MEESVRCPLKENLTEPFSSLEAYSLQFLSPAFIREKLKIFRSFPYLKLYMINS